jgi:hypothetical protein
MMKNKASFLTHEVFEYIVIFIFASLLFTINILSQQGLIVFLMFIILNLFLKSYKVIIKLSLLLIFAIISFFIVDENNKLEIFTIASSFIIQTLHIHSEKFKFQFGFIKKVDVLFSRNSYSFILLLLITYLTQNAYINYESIDWDISSYLVASNNLSFDNLPYQNQWESKQPILYILYKFIIVFSKGNLVLFKLINDLIIFLISLMLFNLVKKELKSNYFSLLISSLYLVFMSTPWGTAEYSEVFSLFFIVLGLNILSTNKQSFVNLFMVGLIFGISIMINIGSAIVIIGTVFFLERNIINKSIYLLLGSTVPLILLTYFYHSRELSKIFLETTFYIPLNYPSSSTFSPKILIDFLRSYFEFNKLLYLIMVLAFITLLKQIRFASFKIYSLLVTSLIFVFIALHGYYHHYIFFIFFLTYSMVTIFRGSSKNLYSLLMLMAIFSVLLNVGPKSVENLYNVDKLQDNYPIYNLQQELNEIVNKEYTVFALDYHLINFYLKQDNFSYIVHPTNLEEEFITSRLIQLNKIQDKEISSLIQNMYPDVVICSEDMQDFNCEVSDYDKRYTQLLFEEINSKENIDYYKDPYKKIRVYIKKDIIK